MAVYKVYLNDLATPGKFWTSATRQAFGAVLQGFFNEVCKLKDARPFTSALTTWAPPVNIQREEIIVNFVNSWADSRIRKHDPNAELESKTGSTAHFVGGKISEVYVDAFTTMPVRGLAVVAFHEAMHNKLYPLDIHADGGGGLASTSVSWNFGLTDKNKQLMAKALSKQVPQKFP